MVKSPAERVETCLICDAHGPVTDHRVAEMMFGTREEFLYRECRACGTLSLLDPPADLSSYYPQDYYSLASRSAEGQAMPLRLARALRTSVALAADPRIARLLYPHGAPQWLTWMRGLHLRRQSLVCDVGSGGGELLVDLQRHGFTDLLGVDPYLHQSVHRQGLTLVRQNLADLDGRFDLVMMHHSFEHMPDPESVLRDIRRLIDPRGHVLIRVPVADSLAWRKYGVNWVQLDAPRHFFLFTRRGLAALAQRTGLQVKRVFYDSWSLQFWGSEQYRLGIPLRAHNSYAESPEASPFTSDEIAAFDRRASELNASGLGDSAGFILSPP